jgi:hypothetical protein
MLNEPARPRVALVDFPPEEFERIVSALGDLCEAFAVDSLATEPGSLSRHQAATALVRLSAAGLSEEEALERLREVRRRFREQEIALLAPQDGDFPIAALAGGGVPRRMLVEQALASEGAALRRLVSFLAEPMSPCPPSGMLSEEGSWSGDALETKADKQRLVQLIVEDFGRFSEDAGSRFRVELCAEEALNNSLFHAFRDAAGKSKYRPSSFAALEPGDRLDVWRGRDETGFFLAVADNAGSLEVETLLAKLRYGEDEESLLLEGGRGLFLMRGYSHEHYVWIAPGEFTLLILAFLRDAPPDDQRPLLIRQGEASRPKFPAEGGAPSPPESLRPGAAKS